MATFRDKLKLGTRTIDERGFLHAPAQFSRIGIQHYTAGELGLQDRPPETIVAVYRSEAEVFKPESLASFQLAPITDEHPSESVNASNWRRLAVGVTGHQVTRDGDHTTGEVLVTDAEAVAKIVKGKAELSCGYGSELDWSPGEWNGQKYEAAQRGIIGNHVALVDVGRCGGSCRVLDGVCQDCGFPEDGEASCNCQGGDDMSATGTPAAAGPQLVSRVVDGLTIQVTEQGAQVIDKLQVQLTDAKSALTDASTKLTSMEADHKKALETKDGEIAGLKTQVDDAALDQRATARAELIDSARTVLGREWDPAGKSNPAIKAEVVTKVMGADAIKDRSADFIDGLYGAVSSKALADQGTDTVRHAVNDSKGTPTGSQQQPQTKDSQPKGRDAYLARLRQGPDLGQAKRA